MDIQLHTIPFQELSLEQLYQLLKLRQEVFVLEQTCLYQDLDDKDQQSVHILAEDKGEIVSCARAFWKNQEEKVAQIGRMCTRMSYRGQSLSLRVMAEAVRLCKENLGAAQVYIEAQCYAIPFYEKLGFKVSSAEFLEDGIPHVEMIL